MVVGKVKGGGEVVVGGGDGGMVPPSYFEKVGAGTSNSNLGPGQAGGPSGPGLVGYGNAAPRARSPGIGEPLGGQALQGQNAYGRDVKY